jgi:hypothetical protein
METRFALLQHTGYGPDHYDLMLQQGQVLWTWQFSVNPIKADAPETLTCRRIADHRLAYLDYEGPVSGRRGQVKRLSGGSCHVEDQGRLIWVHIRRGPMQGSWQLVRWDYQSWQLRKEPPSTPSHGS